MKNLLVFLIISLVCAFILKPTKKKSIWLNTVLIPLVSLIIYLLIVATFFSFYNAGIELGKSIIPAIVAGIIIYNNQTRSSKNASNTFPKMLLIITITVFILTIALLIVQNNNRKFIDSYFMSDTNNPTTREKTRDESIENENSVKHTMSNNDFLSLKSDTIKYDSNGFSFYFLEGDWFYSTEILEDNLSYNILFEGPGFNNSDFLNITFFCNVISPDIWISSYISSLNEDVSYENVLPF
jgi:hypothetical protein